MEEIRYIDIFASKGIEYLLVIGFLIVLVFFLRYLGRLAPAKIERAPARTAELLERWFRLPERLYYHQGHTWAELESNDVARVGVDDFAQILLGVPSAVSLPRVGSKLQQGEKGWEMVFDSTAIPILSPVSGEVIEVNEELLKAPQLINSDPYEAGWLMKVRKPKLKTDFKNLLSGNVARAWLDDTVLTLRSRFMGELGLVLQDGGMPLPGMARNLSPADWSEVALDFLQSREYLQG